MKKTPTLTLLSKRQRKPYSAQIVVIKPEACECGQALPGVVVTFATDQHFDTQQVQVDVLCRVCEKSAKVPYGILHEPFKEPDKPRIKRV